MTIPSSKRAAEDSKLLSVEITRERLYEQVVRELENLIVSGEIESGSTLPSERELAGHFATSRTVVREATKVLSSKGLVTVRHGSGIVVNGQENWKVFDSLALKLQGSWLHVLELRQSLEVEMARLASDRWLPKELNAMRQSMEGMEADIGMFEKRLEHDIAFHNAIAKATHNPLFMRVTESLTDLLKVYRGATMNVSGAAQRSILAHRRIYRAIAARKAEEAAHAMREHLEEVKGDFELLGLDDLTLSQTEEL